MGETSVSLDLDRVIPSLVSLQRQNTCHPRRSSKHSMVRDPVSILYVCQSTPESGCF